MSSTALKAQIFLSELFIKSFRNIDEARLSFGQGINLIIGLNGQGKTNVLEAVALACSLKPLQSLQNTDLIKAGTEQGSLNAFFDGDNTFNLDIELLMQGKKARINDKAIRGASSLTKNIAIVSFIPIELNMIVGSGSLRRRALDLATASLFSDHTRALRAYEKILGHRNKLLKDPYAHKQSQETFTNMLIDEGSNIMLLRLKTLEQMFSFYSQELTKILGPKNHSTISYLTEGKIIKQQSKLDLMAALNLVHQEKKAQESVRRTTLFGPHLDDISFELNGLCAKKTASRGQTRALVLAFKVAQMMAINNIRGTSPILILDDIISELDHNKQENLLRAIQSLGLQTFFSATSLDDFAAINKCAKVFNVNSGAINSTEI